MTQMNAAFDSYNIDWVFKFITWFYNNLEVYCYSLR